MLHACHVLLHGSLHTVEVAFVFLTLVALVALVVELLLGLIRWIRRRPDRDSARRGTPVATRLLFLWIPLGFVAALVAQAVPDSGGEWAHTTECMNNVRNLSYALADRVPRRGWPKQGGRNFVLSLMAAGIVDGRNPDNLAIFWCPGAKGWDELQRFTDDEAWNAVTRESLRTRRFPHLTSYAGRRNDEPAYALDKVTDPGPHVLFGCRHHDDAVILAFTDGKVKYLEWEDLGLDDEPEILFGDGAPHPWLEALSED